MKGLPDDMVINAAGCGKAQEQRGPGYGEQEGAAKAGAFWDAQ